MCLITTWKVPKIAEKDITVYKDLEDFEEGLYSPYWGFTYSVNQLYQTEMELSSDKPCFDYIDRNYFEEYIPDWKTNEEVISIAKGFHSALSPERLEGPFGSIYRCTIPAGSKYYKNPTGLIVSNQIIIHNDVIR